MSEILLEIVINIMTKFTSSSHSVQKGYSHAPSERDERAGDRVGRIEREKERSEIENYYKIFKPTDDGHAATHCCKTKIHVHKLIFLLYNDQLFCRCKLIMIYSSVDVNCSLY